MPLPTRDMELPSRSLRMVLGLPLMAQKRCRALMNNAVSIEAMGSQWTALLEQQVNMQPHIFEAALCRRVTTILLIKKGPKASTPMWVKGLSGTRTLVLGRLLIFCSSSETFTCGTKSNY